MRTDDAEMTTRRLTIRPATEDDLDDLLRVRLSNHGRLARTEGVGGEPGDYDRAMLERDFAMVAWDPNRRLETVRDRNDGKAVGLADFLVRNPEDGHPWIGSVEIHAERQRAGYGTEVLEAIARLFAESSLPIRAVVDLDDTVALRFAVRCGFREIEHRGTRVLLETHGRLTRVISRDRGGNPSCA